MKYRVTYEYRSRVSVEVEAENEKLAEEAGMEEADDYINGSLELYDVKVKPLTSRP